MAMLNSQMVDRIDHIDHVDHFPSCQPPWLGSDFPEAHHVSTPLGVGKIICLQQN